MELDIAQDDFAKLAPSQKGIVTTDAYPDRKYDGVIADISPEANRQKATVQVKVQILNPIHVLTAFENVELPLLLTRLSAQQRRDHVLTALKLVGLEDRVNHLPKQLSGGQEHRVAIACAIACDPSLILADEPTGDLDSHSVTEELEILTLLNTDFHKTIVMVTHDPHAAAYAHVTLHLEKGMLLP